MILTPIYDIKYPVIMGYILDIRGSQMDKNAVATAKVSFLAIIISWVFYLFSYFSRVEPCVLVDNLMQDFSLNASQVGTIISTLYISYGIMQIPWGIIIDKLGCRLVIFTTCVICSLGVLLFGVATASWHLVVARLLIGFSSATAYLACGKIISEMLPTNKYALFMGFTMFVGGIGGVLGSSATAGLANAFGWRQLTCVMAIIGIAISVLTFIFLPKQTVKQTNEKGRTLEGLKLLVTNPSCWLIGLFGCMANLPVVAVAELWGTPFMQIRFGVSNSLASICSAVIFIGCGIGSILAAKVAEKLNSNKKTIILFSIGLILSFLTAVYSDTIGFWTGIALFGLCSIFAGAGTLAFDMTYKYVPSNFAGTSTGYTNMFVMGGGVIFQPLLGYLLDFLRNGKVNPDGSPMYDVVMYRSAFLCAIVFIIISVIGMFFVKEKKSV